MRARAIARDPMHGVRRTDAGHGLMRYAVGHDGQATLAAFRKISKDGHPVSDKGNYRNLQALGDRQIYRCAPSHMRPSPGLCATVLVGARARVMVGLHMHATSCAAPLGWLRGGAAHPGRASLFSSVQAPSRPAARAGGMLMETRYATASAWSMSWQKRACSPVGWLCFVLTWLHLNSS